MHAHIYIYMRTTILCNSNVIIRPSHSQLPTLSLSALTPRFLLPRHHHLHPDHKTHLHHFLFVEKETSQRGRFLAKTEWLHGVCVCVCVCVYGVWEREKYFNINLDPLSNPNVQFSSPLTMWLLFPTFKHMILISYFSYVHISAIFYHIDIARKTCSKRVSAAPTWCDWRPSHPPGTYAAQQQKHQNIQQKTCIDFTYIVHKRTPKHAITTQINLNHTL